MAPRRDHISTSPAESDDRPASPPIQASVKGLILLLIKAQKDKLQGAIYSSNKVKLVMTLLAKITLALITHKIYCNKTCTSNNKCWAELTVFWPVSESCYQSDLNTITGLQRKHAHTQTQTHQYLNYKLLIRIWLGRSGYFCCRYYLIQIYYIWKTVYFRQQPFCKFSLSAIFSAHQEDALSRQNEINILLFSLPLSEKSSGMNIPPKPCVQYLSMQLQL